MDYEDIGMSTPESRAIELYTNPSAYPDVSVPQHVIERTVRNLGKIPAIYLIRAAYRETDGAWAPLGDALNIYNAILSHKS